jgi:hypothetical protein
MRVDPRPRPRGIDFDLGVGGGQGEKARQAGHAAGGHALEEATPPDAAISNTI